MKRLLSALALICAVAPAFAALQTREIEYKDGETTLVGYLAYDDATTGRRPGVMVVHQWTGITDYEKHRAEMLAELGYAAFVADIYGKGVRPAAGAEAGTVASTYKADRALFRRRLNLGLDQLKAQDVVDAGKLGAVGYCFGGTGVLELARSGADVDAVVSFHGGLDSPTPADGANIKAHVLVCHGADDPYVPAAEIAAFEKELKDAKVDYVFASYGDAVHSFTQPMAGDDKSKGAAYNAKADKRSWEHMKVFLAEAFAP